MSTLHETQADIENEQKAINKVGELWGAEVKYCPVAYPVDAVFIKNGEVKAFVEYKRCNSNFGQYQYYLLSMQKYLAMHQYSAYKPVIFIVEFNDCMAYLKMPAIKEKITYLDRSKTTARDSRDNEPMVNFFTSSFKKLFLK